MARGVGPTRRRETLGRGMAVLAMLAGLVLPSLAFVGTPSTPAPFPPASPAPATPRWVGSWATAVSPPVAGRALAGFRNTTIRQRVHVSLGGPWVRLRLTNVFGSGPVTIGPVTAARAGARAGATRAGTLTAATFSGRPTVTLARGGEVFSDPVRLDVPPDSDLLLSLYLPGPTGPATYHAAARTTGWTASGNHTADVTSDGFAGRTASYWFLGGVDVQSYAGGSVAFVGDSITDGGGSTQDADRRWPDYLADRMLTRAPTLQFGVLNAGISGNRLLLDAVNPGQGPSILHRLDRDALDQQSVRTVVLAGGVNDIQQAPVEQDPARIIAGYEQVAARARAAGLRVVGATITPFEGWSQWSPQREAVRREVNTWVRTTGVFDDYLDFDAVLRDPGRPQRLRPDLDCGDHLHPRDSGYAAMAASVDLATLLP